MVTSVLVELNKVLSPSLKITFEENKLVLTGKSVEDHPSELLLLTNTSGPIITISPEDLVNIITSIVDVDANIVYTTWKSQKILRIFDLCQWLSLNTSSGFDECVKIINTILDITGDITQPMLWSRFVRVDGLESDSIEDHIQELDSYNGWAPYDYLPNESEFLNIMSKLSKLPLKTTTILKEIIPFLIILPESQRTVALKYIKDSTDTKVWLAFYKQRYSYGFIDLFATPYNQESLLDATKRGAMYINLFRTHSLTAIDYSKLIDILEGMNRGARDAWLNTFVTFPINQQKNQITETIMKP
jgi:hypothetical protein